MNWRALLDWFAKFPPRIRAIILALIAAVVIVVSVSSCSRSTLLFKGSGELEYQYQGKYGIDVDRSR